jgi:peptidylprolyl isomerase
MSDQVRQDPTSTAADQPTAAERAGNAKRRSQALLGAAAGAVVIAVIVGVFIWVGNADTTTPAVPAAAASAPAAPAPAPSAPAAPPPGAVQADPALQTKPTVKAGKGTLSKLVVTRLVKGKGPAVVKGQTITVNYVGVLFKTGQPFASSWEEGQPAQFPIGVGQVIPGWDQGLVGVPVGSRVQLDIPAKLATGMGPGAPTGDLRFVVDILAAQ